MKVLVGRRNETVIIDREDFKKFFVKGNCINVASHGYVRVVQGKKQAYLHRLIMNAPKNLEIDHKNGNRLDNRKNNLRLCTRTENARNTSAISGYKGVHYSKEYRYWVAQITKDYKCRHLGTFHTAAEAARAYNIAAKKLHGKFARLNIINI